MQNLVRIGNRLVNTSNINYVDLLQPQQEGTKQQQQQQITRVHLKQVPEGQPTYIDFVGEESRAWLNFADTVITTLYSDRIENSNSVTLRPAKAQTGSAGA